MIKQNTHRISDYVTITVSLLKSARAGNDVGYGSGINWGIRPNGTKRNPNQAYIPYNKADRKNGFFPDKRKKGEKNCPIFKVVTKEYLPFLEVDLYIL